jgi:hypothetical protein
MGIWQVSRRVPGPVGEKREGMPAPPARSFSARLGGQVQLELTVQILLFEYRVDINVGGMHSCDLVIFRSREKPYSLEPHSFEIRVSSLVPHLAVALIRFSKIPQSPKPPATIVAPSKRSWVAY